MKQLAIFDLDGTLLDTIDDLATAVNFALAENGFAGYDVDAYKMFVGNGIEKLFERALPEGNKTQENIARIKESFLAYYTVHCEDKTRPYEGIVQMLSTLSDQGVMLAVASNKYHTATFNIVRKYFPNIEFAVVFGHRDGAAIKPDPQIVFDILQETGVEAQNAIYVGDSGVDMQTAINSSVDAVGVTWGFRSVDELMRYSPRYIAHTVQEVVYAVVNS